MPGAGPARAQDAPAEGPPGGGGLPAGATVLNVPYLPQSELLCGGAAAAMVLRYWGMSGVRAEDFGDLVSRARGGIRAGELAGRLRELSWDVFPFDGRFEEVRRHLRLGRPVISLLEVGEDRYHYVVLVGEAGDRLVLHDPAAAPYRLVDRPELEAAWEATDGLSLLVVPGGDRAQTTRPPRGTGEGAAAGGEGAAQRGEPDAPEARSLPARCRSRLDRAVAAATADRIDEADRLLSEGDCSAEPAFLRELAGVRLRRGHARDAIALSRRALALDANDRHAARTLATALYVSDEREAALDAWNRIGQPTVDLVRIIGLDRARHLPVARLLGLKGGDRLTAKRLRLARRRLAELPAASISRVGYVPTGGGRVDLVAGLAERSGLPISPAPLAVTGLRAAIHREVALTAVSPLGHGETWSAAWRWWRSRPAVRFLFETPSEFGRPAIWSLAANWERETVALAPPTPTSRSDEERVGTSLGWSSWLTPLLRAGARIGYDRWQGAQRPVDGDPPEMSLPSEAYLRTGVTGEIRVTGDHLRALADGDRWLPLDGGPAFGTAGARLEAMSRTRPAGFVASGRLYARTAGGSAPRTAWPGAGTGIARPNLLRAHPLLDDGAIAGRAFDRHLAGGGVELARWFELDGTLRIGGATFLDAARTWGARPGVSLVDVGLGLRLTTAAGGPTVRIDAATGLSDDEWALSVGWAAGD